MNFLSYILVGSALSAVVVTSPCAARERGPAAPQTGMSKAEFHALPYVPRLIHVIRSNTAYEGHIPQVGNPSAGYLIELTPDGFITKVELKKSSGHPLFDAAVMLGIAKSSPLPGKTAGEPERKLYINFSMKAEQPTAPPAQLQ